MEIVLYSTGCPKCTVLKSKLQSKEIEYREENNVEQMLAIGLTEVPALQIDGKILPFADAVRWINRQ